MDDSFYIKNAINMAKNNDISGALRSLSYARESELKAELKALCLRRLGRYAAAAGLCGDYGAFDDSPLPLLGDISAAAAQKRYSKAVDIAESLPESVLRRQMIGCLYMMAGLRKKALQSFHEALKMDIYNKKTIKLTLAAYEQKGGGFSEFIRTVGYRLGRR